MSLDHEFNQVMLSPLEPSLAQSQERRLLQIQASEGLNYHVEVRRAIGSDARLDSIFFEGALVKRAKDLHQANKSFIIDPTPETPSVNSTKVARRHTCGRSHGCLIQVLPREPAALRELL